MTIDQMVALLQHQQEKGRGGYSLGVVLDSGDGQVFLVSAGRAAVVDSGDPDVGRVFVLDAYETELDDADSEPA